MAVPVAQTQQISIINITVEELQKAITLGVQKQLQELKEFYQPKEKPEYLTRTEVSKLLQVDLSTLHNWKHKGTLVPLGIGNRVLYTRKSIEDALVSLKK